MSSYGVRSRKSRGQETCRKKYNIIKTNTLVVSRCVKIWVAEGGHELQMYVFEFNLVCIKKKTTLCVNKS